MYTTKDRSRLGWPKIGRDIRYCLSVLKKFLHSVVQWNMAPFQFKAFSDSRRNSTIPKNLWTALRLVGAWKSFIPLFFLDPPGCFLRIHCDLKKLNYVWNKWAWPALICLAHTEDPKNAVFIWGHPRYSQDSSPLERSWGALQSKRNNFEFEMAKGICERCLVNAVFLRLT